MEEINFNKPLEKLLDEIVISIKEFEEKDYCFDLTDEKLSHDVDEYLEQVNDLLAEPLTELDKLAMIEEAKKIHIYEKDYFKLPEGFIEGHIIDYFNDNYDCDHWDLNILDYIDIKSETSKIVEKINNSKCWYIKGNFVGFIDLSEQVKELINDEFKN